MLRAALLLCAAVCCSAAGQFTADWKSLDSRPLPSWYDESKVGIFLHWGVFSVPGFGSEWFWANWKGASPDYVHFMQQNFKPGFSYQEFAPKFTAELYDPAHWAEIFKASGAKYVVLTSKHHEGYTLWPSKVAWSWNAMDVGPKRDLLGDLAKAIRNNTDIHFGVYHSMFDWYHPLYLLDKKNGYKTQYFVDSKTMPELLELVTEYKPEVIWSDGDWEAPDVYWKSTDFLAWLYNDSPVKDTVVVNDRWGSGIPCKHGGYYTCTDRFNPKTLQKHKWENAMTVDKGSWGYRRNVQLGDYLTMLELVTTLVETVSCGGNLLVNVGPTPDGRIETLFEERLRGLGSWLKVNGEAIYATNPCSVQNDTLTSGVWYTCKGENIYATVLNWPKQNILRLGSLDIGPKDSVTMLGVDGQLQFQTKGKVSQITFPQLTPDQLPSTIAWVIKVDTVSNEIWNKDD